MGRFLSQYSDKSRFIVICLLLASIVYISLSASVVYATNHNAKMTGYAFAYNLGSASGANLVQGHFGNHAPNLCPSDPAAFWAWNTNITMVSPSSVSMKNSSNTSYNRSSFTLKDNGDPSCSKGNYWADIYFGSFKNPLSGCSCNGFTSCAAGTNGVNNCTQAVNWGSSTRTYSGP